MTVCGAVGLLLTRWGLTASVSSDCGRPVSLLGGNPVLLADTPPALELIADHTDGRQSADRFVSGAGCGKKSYVLGL